MSETRFAPCAIIKVVSLSFFEKLLNVSKSPKYTALWITVPTIITLNPLKNPMIPFCCLVCEMQSLAFLNCLGISIKIWILFN